MANVDIAPTLLDLCGLAGPGAGQGGAQGLDPGRGSVDAARAHGMQGLSAADHLHHPDHPAARDQVLIQHYGLHLPILQRCLVRSQWKYVLQEDGFEELYDLEADPFECSNLAGKAPDTPEVQTCLCGLRLALRNEMQRLGDRPAGLWARLQARVQG